MIVFKRSCLLFFILLNALTSNGQVYINNDFLDQQFWIGVQSSLNLTKANPIERHTVFSPTEGKKIEDYYKKYKNYSKVGTDFSLFFAYDYQGFGFALFPSYSKYRFEYSNEYNWADTSNANFQLKQNSTTVQSLDYLKIPISFRYTVKQLKVRPIAEIGFYFSTLISANRITSIEKTDFASGSADAVKNNPYLIGNKNLFLKSNIGWFGGLGVAYSLGNLNASLVLNYFKNTHNITNRKNKYDDPFLGGETDLQDDIKLGQWSAALSFSMPMRYLISKYAKSR
jgi:hypothetical protein